MACLTTCASLCALALAGGRPPVIVTGWDSPDTKQFREGLAAFEEWGLFDGTTLRASRTLADGTRVTAINAFSAAHWEWSEFAEALGDLQAAAPTTCVENYLMCYSNPGDVDWFDDAGWTEVIDHWRLLARLAKQGGLRGLLFDAEPYTPPASQYLYRAQAGRAEHSFAQYRAKARERGAEVMRAVAEEYPDITLFSYRLFSDLLGLLGGDLERALEPDTYGLLPSFVDGWLDVAPEGLRIIEGTEDIGYRANSTAEYDGAFTRLKLHLSDFLAPEHRTKVERQFRIGQSLYLDAYANPKGSPWHIDREGTTAAARLAANLASALAASDGLVWLYGEKGRWWEVGDAGWPLWPSLIEGAREAIGRAKDPSAYAASVWAREPAPANLLPNPALARTGEGAGPPDGWSEWQDEGSRGTIATAEGVVGMSAVANGVVNTTVEVKPGRLYVVRVWARSEGSGLASLFLGWKTADGRWTANPQNRRLVGAGVPDAEGWREIVGLIEVPASAGQMIYMLAATGQSAESDRCQFREPGLAEVE